jgi:hypothetical protein
MHYEMWPRQRVTGPLVVMPHALLTIPSRSVRTRHPANIRAFAIQLLPRTAAALAGPRVTVIEKHPRGRAGFAG